MDQNTILRAAPALLALLAAACGNPSVADEGEGGYTEQPDVPATVASSGGAAVEPSGVAAPEQEPEPTASRVVIDLPAEQPAAKDAAKPAVDQEASKPAAVAQPKPTAEPAQEAAPAERVAAAPPRLDTGYDLSKIRVPVTNPVAPVRATPTPGVNAEGVPNALAAPPEPVALTHIDVGEDGGEHDFGELLQGAVREHVFRFSNGGENDLTLTQIKPSCGCTVAQTMVVGAEGERTPYVLGTPLAPGTQVELTTKLNTRGKRGPLHSNINLFGNVENNVTSLRLSADVKTFLDVEPTNLNFEKMRTGEVKTGTFVVTSSVAERFKLEVDETLLPANRSPVGGVPPDAGNPNREVHDKTKEFNVELVPIEPDADGAAARWEVKVVVGPEVPEGNKSYPVRLFSDQVIEGVEPGPDGEPPRHEVLAYVMAHVTGMVDLEPRYLSFGLVRPGQVITKSVIVRSYDEGWTFAEPTAEVLGFRGEFEQLEYVSTSVTPLEDGSGWEVGLTVEGMPEDFNGSFRGKLVVHTGHEKKPRVEAPFSGVVRGGVTQTQPPQVPTAQPTPAPPAPISGDGHQHGDGHDHDHGGGGGAR